MISRTDWLELAGGWPPFSTPWPVAPAPWRVAAADDTWIRSAGRRAELEILLELDRRLERILEDVRGVWWAAPYPWLDPARRRAELELEVAGDAG